MLAGGKIHPEYDYLTQRGENGQGWSEQRVLLTSLGLIDFLSLTMRDPARKISRERC